MSRNTYILILTLLFSITYLPEIPSIIFNKQILINHIPRVTIKSILLFLICFMESSLIKKEYPGIIGWILSFTLLIGFLMLIIHSTWSREVTIISAILIILNLIFHAFIEKNKNLLHYLLFLFVAFRVTTITVIFSIQHWRSTSYYEIAWWFDIILGIIISLIGIKYCYRIFYPQK